MIVAPTILEPTAEQVVKQIVKLSPYFDHFQVDVQDGRYTSNKTASLEELKNYCFTHKIDLQDKTFNIDIMTQDTERDVACVMQLSPFLNVISIFVHDSQVKAYPSLIRKYPAVALGLSLNPEDSVEALSQKYPLKTIPIMQIMTVHPGPQGQSFIPECINKIDQLRTLNYRNKIYVDGGLNDRTIPLISTRTEKPDVLCVGSYLTHNERLGPALDFLKGMI